MVRIHGRSQILYQQSFQLVPIPLLRDHYRQNVRHATANCVVPFFVASETVAKAVCLPNV